jgi:beta-galactosidase
LMYSTTYKHAANGRSGPFDLSIGLAKDVVLQVIVNGKVVGKSLFNGENLTFPVDLVEGDNDIVLLSTMNGLVNYAHAMETYVAGVSGTIKVDGTDLTNSTWDHTIGLLGESKRIFAEDGSKAFIWQRPTAVATVANKDLNPAAKWFKSEPFPAPSLELPLAIDLVGLSKGAVWINGRHLGRYWNIIGNTNTKGCDTCDYRGEYQPDSKCRVRCNEPSQRYYHVPRDWLRRSGNVIVILEEFQATVGNVAIVQHNPEAVDM